MFQEQALAILKTGANVFLTGEPGSGKTHTINNYVRYLRTHGVNVAITATTGIAATHIGGLTIHSWSGIGISKSLSEYELDALSSREKLQSRINKTAVLIIDEISMLEASTIDLVEKVCRTVRGSSLPWGGLQVVFVGDFFQLPPVSRGEEVLFAFNSQAWNNADPVVCYLTEQYRQTDLSYFEILNAIRSGELDESIREKLRSRLITDADPEIHTRLYSHNLDVDRINEEKLKSLAEEESQYRMDARGAKPLIEQLKRGCLSPEILRLKIGAKVMFTKNNFDQGFVNGTLGEVSGFTESGPVVRIANGTTIDVPVMEWAITDGDILLARIMQYPLRLAWAITIHKSQGMTLDAAVMDLSAAFEYGQGYVALSRVRSFDGLKLLGLNERALMVHPEILEVDESFRAKSAHATRFFGDLPEEDLIKLREDFIRASGGYIEEIEPVNALAHRRKVRAKADTHEETHKLYKLGMSVDDIAAERKLTVSTIMSHLEELYMRGLLETDDLRKLLTEDMVADLPEVHDALKESEGMRLSSVYQKFEGRHSYDQLRLARLLME